MRTVTLGRTGLTTSLLGFGTGTSGWNHVTNQTRLGQEKFTALARHAYDCGVRYFDSAEMYGTHPFLREALRGLPREELVIGSKTITRDPDAVRKEIDQFREELGVDCIDSLLMHAITEPDWPQRYRPIMDVLEDARQRGIIRAHGCSFHSIEALEAAVGEPWLDTCMARINPWGVAMDKVPEGSQEQAPGIVMPILQRLHAQGVGVLAMKVFGVGRAIQGEDRHERIVQSLRYLLESGALDVLNIGFEMPEQIDEVVAVLTK